MERMGNALETYDRSEGPGSATPTDVMPRRVQPIHHQWTAPTMPRKLASEKVVVAAPMSFAGSAQRLWKMTQGHTGLATVLLVMFASTLITLAWTTIFFWYCIFGLLLVPYRLIRRSQRKHKVRALQHREQLAAIRALSR